MLATSIQLMIVHCLVLSLHPGFSCRVLSGLRPTLHAAGRSRPQQVVQAATASPRPRVLQTASKTPRSERTRGQTATHQASCFFLNAVRLSDLHLSHTTEKAAAQSFSRGMPGYASQASTGLQTASAGFIGWWRRCLQPCAVHHENQCQHPAQSNHLMRQPETSRASQSAVSVGLQWKTTGT